MVFDMPNLIDVKITSYHTLKTIQSCVTRCQNVKYLTLHDYGNCEPTEENYVDIPLRNIATNLRQLKSLCLSGFFLTETGLDCFSACTTSGPQSPSSVRPQLETLELGDCHIFDGHLQCMSSVFHSLRKLTICSHFISNTGVGYLANMRCLRKLELSSCTHIDEECIELLSEAGSMITSLKITRCKHFGYTQDLEYIGQLTSSGETLFVRKQHN